MEYIPYAVENDFVLIFAAWCTYGCYTLLLALVLSNKRQVTSNFYNNNCLLILFVGDIGSFKIIYELRNILGLNLLKWTRTIKTKNVSHLFLIYIKYVVLALIKMGQSIYFVRSIKEYCYATYFQCFAK